MRRVVKMLPLVGVVVLAIAGCDPNGVNAPKLETTTGVITKVTYEEHKFWGNADWDAGVKLQDGTTISLKTYGGQTELNSKVSEGSCVQFKREAGGDSTVQLDGADDLDVIADDKCPWAK